MKTGRKPNGEDPKKPKAQGEVKVTAKKPVEPPQKQYTWEDVERNDAAKARNKAAKEQYESDVASYNKAMKLYNEGASYDDMSEPLSMMNKSGSKIKGKPTTFTAATGGISARQMTEDYEKGIKSGEYVDINDPRISEKNRYYLKGTLISSNSMDSNKWGTIKSKAVPASVAFDKDLNWKKLYDEDFDPYEYEKARKSGKFEEYTSKNPSLRGMHVPTYGGYLEKYGKPEQAKAPTYEKEENIDIKKIPIPKMRQLKSDETIEKGVIKKKTYGKLAEYKAPAPTEKPDWEAPSKTETKFKTRFKGASNANTFERGPLKSARVVDLNRSSSKEVKVKGYDKEAKMAKAYFSGYEGKSKFDIEGTSEERGAIGKLKADKASLKEGIKAVRRGTAAPSTVDKSERIAGLRAAKKDVKSEIKQAKLASKYVSKLGQDYTGVREGQDLRSTGKIKTFTPTAMAGFSGSKQDTFDPEANFKSQLNNPANRNTIAAQEKSLSFKERTAQRKADRAQRKADTKLQQSIKIPN